MKKENLKRANEIQRRMDEMEMASKWLEDRDRHVYIIAQGCTMDESVKIPDDCRNFLHGLCLGIHARLEKEFEEL